MTKNIKCLKGFFRVCMFAVMIAVILPCYTYMVGAASSTAATVSTSKPGCGLVQLDSGVLNVRAGASTSYEIVGHISNNSYVMIVGQLNDFYRILYCSSGDNPENYAFSYGYVSKDYVSFISSEHYLQVSYVSSTSYLNMRSGSSTSSSVKVRIPSNTAFAYLWETSAGDWCYSVYGDVSGYVSADYVSIGNF